MRVLAAINQLPWENVISRPIEKLPSIWPSLQAYSFLLESYTQLPMQVGLGFCFLMYVEIALVCSLFWLMKEFRHLGLKRRLEQYVPTGIVSNYIKVQRTLVTLDCSSFNSFMPQLAKTTVDMHWAIHKNVDFWPIKWQHCLWIYCVVMATHIILLLPRVCCEVWYR